MLPVEIGRALHVFVPSVWQALDFSYTAATDLGHRGLPTAASSYARLRRKHLKRRLRATSACLAAAPGFAARVGSRATQLMAPSQRSKAHSSREWSLLAVSAPVPSFFGMSPF